jgi:hypothetical protein
MTRPDRPLRRSGRMCDHGVVTIITLALTVLVRHFS